MRSKILICLTILLSITVSVMFYKGMPEKLATHWNIDGKADGYSDRLTGLFLLPMMMIAITLLLYFLPTIDPLKKNIGSFWVHYENFIVLFCFFMFYVHLLTIAWGLGLRFNMSSLLLPGLGVFFFFLGDFLRYTKRNWFAGIRTPWTLHSDKIWVETHKFAGKLFKISGIIVMLGIFIPSYSFLLLVPILVSAALSIVYSYILYRRSTRAP